MVEEREYIVAEESFCPITSHDYDLTHYEIIDPWINNTECNLFIHQKISKLQKIIGNPNN